MKKLIPILIFLISGVALSANAQDAKTKTKPITTPVDKVNNVVRPHHKISHGTKYVNKSATGRKTETEVKTARPIAKRSKRKVKKD